VPQARVIAGDFAGYSPPGGRKAQVRSWTFPEESRHLMAGFNGLVLATIASAFAFGMVLALLGSIKLPLAQRLGIDEARVGGLLSALNLAFIPMMLISGILVDRLGIQGVLIVGSVLAGLAIFALALVKTYAGSVY